MIENRVQMDEDEGFMYAGDDEAPYLDGDLLDRPELFYGHPGYDDPVTLMSREGAATPDFMGAEPGEYLMYDDPNDPYGGADRRYMNSYMLQQYPEQDFQHKNNGYPSQDEAIDDWDRLIGEPAQDEVAARPSSRYGGRPASPRYDDDPYEDRNTDMYGRPVTRSMPYGYR